MKAKERYFKNRNMLLNYVDQSNSPELKKFVDCLLTLEVWKENRPTLNIYKKGDYNERNNTK